MSIPAFYEDGIPRICNVHEDFDSFAVVLAGEEESDVVLFPKPDAGTPWTRDHRIILSLIRRIQELQKPEPKNCSTCRYFCDYCETNPDFPLDPKAQILRSLWECHYNAPSPWGELGWPTVNKTDFCGNWQRKEQQP